VARSQGEGDWVIGVSKFSDHFKTDEEMLWLRDYVYRKVTKAEAALGLPKSTRPRIGSHIRKQCASCPKWLTAAWGRTHGPNVNKQVDTNQPALSERFRTPHEPDEEQEEDDESKEPKTLEEMYKHVNVQDLIDVTSDTESE